MNEIVSQSC